MKRAAVSVVMGTVLLLFCGLLYTAPVYSVEELTPTPTEILSSGSNMAVKPHHEGFNRETCEIRCRSIYGISPYIEEHASGGGGMGTYARYLLIARCIEQCNKRFWKEFDEKMRELDLPLRK